MKWITDLIVTIIIGFSMQIQQCLTIRIKLFRNSTNTQLNGGDNNSIQLDLPKEYVTSQQELEIVPIENFIQTNISLEQVTLIDKNLVSRRILNTDCLFSGTIKNDSQSHISLSLCNGLQMYIQSKNQYFYVNKEKNESIWLHDETSGECGVSATVSSNRKRGKRNLHWTKYMSDRNQSIIKKKNHAVFIKVLIVADQSMFEYHETRENLQHYILTLMSRVSLLFKEASIGNAISISVTKIWILEALDFSSPNSTLMLKKFCRWQYETIVKKQYDVALLLTRSQLCKISSIGTSCDTLGLATIDSMCDSERHCVIVRDNGLSSSHTIAHEFGHALGMPHDDDSNKCEQFEPYPTEYNYIMARSIQNSAKPVRWSHCSQYYMKYFLQFGKSQCLLKRPAVDYTTNEIDVQMPGTKYDVNQQCHLQFGPGAKRCSYMPICGNLWCTDQNGSENEGCTTHYTRWAEGTVCGTNRLCHHGNCVPHDQIDLLNSTHGGWGKWSHWSDCSRSCGGGVKKSTRLCDSPTPKYGGDYCSGDSVLYASCNTQSCPYQDELHDFRDVQCRAFNTKRFNGVFMEWTAKYGFLNEPKKQCQLYCTSKQSADYYLLKDKVIDGTKCNLNSFDICVDGTCHPGGCDNKLHSQTKLDKCGTCGGNGTTCIEISGVYNKRIFGYREIVKIPKGSSNIEILQSSQTNRADENYLALVDAETHEYILNGKQTVSTYFKEIVYGSVIITYSGSAQIIEKIFTMKNIKLHKDLIVEILAVGELDPPNVQYSFTMVRDQSRYEWRSLVDQRSNCDSICNGTQLEQQICMDQVENEQVPIGYCAKNSQHLIKRPCNTYCSFNWILTNKGSCLPECGAGMRQLYYKCAKFNIEKETDRLQKPWQIIDDKYCKMLRRPILHEEYCYNKCTPLITYQWKPERWAQCSNDCGRGLQQRTVNCKSHSGVSVADKNCGHLPKLKVIRPCKQFNCSIVWLKSQWSMCSSNCMNTFEMRYRNVTCNRVINGTVTSIRIKDKYCHIHKKPDTEVKCPVIYPCPNYYWKIGAWRECTHSCGKGGRQTRQLLCIDKKTRKSVNKDLCSVVALKPKTRRKCNQKNCLYRDCRDVKKQKKTTKNKEYHIFVQNRIVKIYCYKMDTNEPEEYISLNNALDNYAQHHKYCTENCQCNSNQSTDLIGSTFFWKIRIDITTLNIISNDFTFSHSNQNRTKIPFGASNQCEPACSLYRFSINLTGTSFILSHKTQLLQQKIIYIHTRDITGRIIVGDCLNFCYQCSTGTTTSLQLEVAH